MDRTHSTVLYKTWEPPFNVWTCADFADFGLFSPKSRVLSLRLIPHWLKLKFSNHATVITHNGSPSQGSEHSGLFRSHFAPPTFSSTFWYKPVSDKWNRFSNWFSKQSTMKIQNSPALTGFRFFKTGSETGLCRKVLGNVASTKWRRNILGCSDSWEGDPMSSWVPRN